MKQIIHNFKTGKTSLIDVPIPAPGRGQVLIRSTYSLVSLGTERMLVEFGKASLINKARQQPEKVRQVFDKIKSDGLFPTIKSVFMRLDEPIPLGYSNVGIVTKIGEDISDIMVGDRVVSNGKHAEYVCVSKNLVAKIPENVTDIEASFTVPGAIGLQGIRLCNPTFGETIVVFGLGLLGLLTCQILLSSGCKVIGIDVDSQKCQIANKWGVQTINLAGDIDPIKFIHEITYGTGADGVIITASTKDNKVISQAAQMCRKRGRIILVGVVGLNLNRSDFYEKELTFQVSCSYGPGRYDDNYEKKGIDYPLPYVRWTEKRNFEAVLNAISSGKLILKDLITEIVDLNDYNKIYENIVNSKTIASIIKYSESAITDSMQRKAILNDKHFVGSKAVIGIIGAGNFTKMTMLPALKNSSSHFKWIASSSGVSATLLAKKFNFSYSTTDYKQILNDPEVDTVFIATRHGSHAHLVVEALKANKHVFVEKPLALTYEELQNIIQEYQMTNKTLMVGFNRRFSPHVQAIKKSLGNECGPINIIATMNAGYIPDNNWVHDLKEGGGRIVGEACHYFDLCLYLTGAEIESICMNALGEHPSINTDNASILLKFRNGSNAVINYFSNGSKSYGKERIEVYGNGKVFVIDNFRITRGYGVNKFKSVKTRINKGHKEQFSMYIQRIKEGGEPLIPIKEILNVSQATLAAIQSLKEKRWVSI